MAKEVLHLKGDPRCVEISEHPGVVDCSDVKATSVEASLAILLPLSQAEGALRKLRLNNLSRVVWFLVLQVQTKFSKIYLFVKQITIASLIKLVSISPCFHRVIY